MACSRGGWRPAGRRFVYGSDEERNKMLKLIPHIAQGSWMIKQSVGSTPAILGKALKTTYYQTDKVGQDKGGELGAACSLP